MAEAQKLAGPDLQIETVYCLGLCATAPAAMLDGRVHGRLDTQKLLGLLGAAK
jgi:formate dehydrogenase subunit gamma